jgi:hypothetical protein
LQRRLCPQWDAVARVVASIAMYSPIRPRPAIEIVDVVRRAEDLLPNIPPEMQEALDLGIHLFAGEAEGRMADVLRDVANGTAKPIYNYLRRKKW